MRQVGLVYMYATERSHSIALLLPAVMMTKADPSTSSENVLLDHISYLKPQKIITPSFRLLNSSLFPKLYIIHTPHILHANYVRV
jgi:hypothetical protein